MTDARTQECGFYLGCGGRPDDPQHAIPGRTMREHPFDPRPTPRAAAAEADTLRSALEAENARQAEQIATLTVKVQTLENERDALDAALKRLGGPAA